MRSMALTAKDASSRPISTLRPQDWCGKTLQNSPLSGSVTASPGRRKADSLDRKVNATLQGSWLGLFLIELFEGVGQLALFLLLRFRIFRFCCAHFFVGTCDHPGWRTDLIGAGDTPTETGDCRAA